MNKIKIHLHRLVENALEEDIGYGDITTDGTIIGDKICKGRLLAKEEGKLAGKFAFIEVFKVLNDEIKCDFYKEDGESFDKNTIIAEITGRVSDILKGERTALNFIQHLSGIATLTAKYVKISEKYGVKIIDTRKTLPGMRMLQKYAVKSGGGLNHRIGLYDAALIKDNHIKAAGSITAAVTSIRKKIGPTVKIETETFSLKDVEEAILQKVDIIMLDNFKLEDIREAIKLIGGKAAVEVSGGVNLENLEEFCRLKPDYISVGRLTNSAPALDFSLKLE